MKTRIIHIKGKRGDLHLRGTLFWDIDKSLISAEGNVKLIIERVFTRGNIDEFFQVTQYYSEDTIKSILLKLGHLDKKTLNFASKMYDLQKSDFKCYIRKRSRKTHWH